MVLRDDLGAAVDVTGPAHRVVSLVPSLTEALVATRPEAIVGATDWCTHPADLDVARVRGTKNPDVKKIVELRPDLVVVNQEENRELDVRRMREAGILVWVTVIETVPQALESMSRLFDEGLRWGRPPWLDQAVAAWDGPLPAVRTRVAVPIWRDPWMVVGRATFTGDLLRRLGAENVYAGHADRYPKVTVEVLDASGADLVLLPDEPYVFTAEDGPEAFARTATRLVSGRLLTLYGPSLLEAAELTF
ncbi:MAG: ABC transporter, substrate-binding protein (cluster 8, B12/iron complex) [uncultured Nocardioidaceae bacterium]|uniref:ABC transporter, substrate-binding protein (Cluster 8, B12/iron complex) n=1 Tax=uncultured Nocardioidaceae bacterium TaxID=253824 RepID=A0A6J4N0H3_9ACTN|nr:MAG: ABC transporter, substrate-binding protein (cluster 8, B12/iron complex) [uncultured Nocardioidaceae bacterium]